MKCEWVSESARGTGEGGNLAEGIQSDPPAFEFGYQTPEAFAAGAAPPASPPTLAGILKTEETCFLEFYESRINRRADLGDQPYNCTGQGNSPWQTQYSSYDRAGNSTQWTHPASFTVTNTFSVVGRLTGVTSSLDDATHPATLATGPTYAPHGGIATLVNGAVSGGTQRQESYDYNNRLQPVRMQLGTASRRERELLPGVQLLRGLRQSHELRGAQSAAGWQQGEQRQPRRSYFFQDNTSTPTPNVGHTATVGYDKLNRLNTFQPAAPRARA